MVLEFDCAIHGRQRVANAAAAFSPTTKAARLPRPPEELVDALQERIHEEVGPVRKHVNEADDHVKRKSLGLV
jgi:hypothetical protein